jgi:hypothetical protein
MTFTTSDATAVLNAGRGTAYAAWTPYFAAFTANPTDAGTLTAELSGGSYARQAVTLGAPATKATSNTAQVAFSATPGVVITHIGLCDAATAGTLRRYVALGSSVTVGTSGQVTIAIGALTDTLA